MFLTWSIIPILYACISLGNNGNTDQLCNKNKLRLVEERTERNETLRRWLALLHSSFVQIHTVTPEAWLHLWILTPGHTARADHFGVHHRLDAGVYRGPMATCSLFSRPPMGRRNFHRLYTDNNWTQTHLSGITYLHPKFCFSKNISTT